MNKLVWVYDLILKLDYNFAKLRKHGFVVKYTDSGSQKIWIHRKRKIVVKTPCLVRHERFGHPKNAIPTISFNIPENKQRHYPQKGYTPFRTVFIQPLADVSRKETAFIRLIDLGHRGKDFKRANVAMYRNKPVLIDW